MRLNTALAAAALAVITPCSVEATRNATFVAQQIANISSCGLTCLRQTIPAVGCSIADTDCQCSSSELVSITANCMYANCSFPETLALSRIQAAICERPYESQNHMMRVMTIVCAVITVSAVFLRLLTKSLLSQRFGLDDIFIFIALIAECFFTAFGVKLEEHGFGNHVWTIDDRSIPQLFMWFYACEILYVLTIGFVKISLLFFYLRVFPKRSFRILCWATVLFCVLSSAAFILVTIFQCAPIQFVWDKNIKGGTCLNYNAVAWSNAALNIFQDLIIVVLPIRETLSLRLNLKQKVGLVTMFCVGGFVFVTSMIRLDSLRTFGLTADPMWDNVPTTFWSTLETTAAIFCACMPAVRAGLVHIFPFLSSLPRTQNMKTPSTIQPGDTLTVIQLSGSQWVPAYLMRSLPRAREHSPTTELLVKAPPTRVSSKPVYQSQNSMLSISSFHGKEKPLPMIPEYGKSYI